jgi:hypothetical protein
MKKGERMVDWKTVEAAVNEAGRGRNPGVSLRGVLVGGPRGF